MQSHTTSVTWPDGRGTRMNRKAADLKANNDPAGRADAFNKASPHE